MNSGSFGVLIVDYLVLGSLIGVFGIAGDLFESFIKRCLDVKDMSNLLPGW
jgi:CDP-diglyceride synthetase